eukprot:4900681-Amphidinium_carterae.1
MASAPYCAELEIMVSADPPGQLRHLLIPHEPILLWSPQRSKSSPAKLGPHDSNALLPRGSFQLGCRCRDQQC